jgi:putative ABC transport system permease protein
MSDIPGYNLERAIAGWSKSLRRHPSIEDGDAADLEGYLRDKINDLVGQGFSEKEAFERAEREFTASEALGRDYYHSGMVWRFQFPWRMTMWNNYLKTAVRNFYKNRGYSFLNIAGMTIGITACFFIGLYIQAQLSFDRFNENFDRIYRITFKQATTAPALAPAMRDSFPEVENYVHMYDPGEVLIKRLTDNTTFKARTLFASAELFDVFTLPLVHGDPATALKNAYTAVIDEETVQKHFRSEDPVGQVLNISTRFGVGDYQITGIMRDVPPNSHFRPHVLISQETFNTFGNDLESWTGNWIHSYVLLKENADARAVQERLPQLIAANTGEAREGYALQRLADIHLKSSAMAFSIEPGSDINYLYVLSLAAFLILLIACSNYANLITAISMKRFREIGVRKAFGAERAQLIGQFLLESVAIVLTAVVFSLFLFGLLIKPAAAFFGVEAQSLLIRMPRMIVLLLGIGVISAVLSGIYPAVYSSRIRPAEIFRRIDAEKPGKSRLRNGLVAVQFAISAFLIIAAVTVGRQVNFIRNKELGFNREQILVMSVGQNKDLQNRGDIFKTELMKIPGVQGLSFSSTLPMNIDWRNGFDYEGRTDQSTRFMICCCYVDPDYCDVFGLNLIAGRGFSRDNPTDTKQERAFIINEAAARMLAWENPIGKRMAFEGKVGRVVGVVKDFHNLPLSMRIEPVALIQSERNRRLLSIKVRSANMKETVTAVKTAWDRFANGWPFEYQFMDETYDTMYRSEIHMGRQFRVFSAVSLFLTCFGLFGLVSFMTERRMKEIGIRKVLGASAAEICLLLGGGFTKPVVLANLIAWPVAYFYLKGWLQGFTYHADIGLNVFLLAGISTWMIAMIAVTGQSYRAASSNPVKSIRNE